MFLRVIDSAVLRYRDEVTKSDPQIFPHHIIPADLNVLAITISKHNAHNITGHLALEHNSIAMRKAELLYLIRL